MQAYYCIKNRTPVKITRLAPGWGQAGVVRLGIGWQRAGKELATRARDGWRRAGSWLAIGWIETFPSHELAGGGWGEAFIAHRNHDIPMGKISPIGKLPMVDLIQEDFLEWKKITMG